MEKCHFSETQFESYHSRQLELYLGSSLPQYFPTRNQEGDSGVDMVHFTDFYSLFFQYKVPVNLLPSHKKGIGLVGDLYRFGIYNRNISGVKGQYELLWDWASTEPHVYFATPKFHTGVEFHNKYKSILSNTAHFRLRGNFKDPYTPGFNTTKHYVYYSSLSTFGYMYSDEPANIDETSSNLLTEQILGTPVIKAKFGDHLKEMRERMSKLLGEPMVDSISKFIVKGKDSKSDDYFLCNHLLQRYFGLSWTILFNKRNRNK